MEPNALDFSSILSFIAIIVSLGSIAIAYMSYRLSRSAEARLKLDHEFKHTPRFRISNQDIQIYPEESNDHALSYTSTIENQGMVHLDMLDLGIEYSCKRGGKRKYIRSADAMFSLPAGESRNISETVSRDELANLLNLHGTEEVAFFFTVRFSQLIGWQRYFSAPIAVFGHDGAYRFQDNEAHFIGGWESK